jgi:carbonic anhydrase/acetyltransferase-like protein (isoleucine patch superfamily)
MADIRSFADKRPRIAADAWVDPAAVVIGDVTIGAGASVWPMAVIRGDIHAITIGERTSIQDGSVLHVTHDSAYNPGGYPLRVGADVIVGHKVVLHGCTIGDHCLVGMGSIVLDGAELEPYVMLGAGSLVPPNKRLTGRSLWLGSPARLVRELNEQEIEFLRYAAGNYVRLGQAYRDGASGSD